MNIEICRDCRGIGEVSVSLYRGETEHRVCKSCGGTGKVKTKTYFLEVPYNKEDNLIHKTDAEIHKLIQNLKTT